MSSFAKSIFTLSVGNLVAQIISIGLMPVITRLYEPASFGVFSLYVSIIMVVFPISTLRYNSAIMLPREEVEAASLLLLSCLSVVVTAFVLIPVVLLILSYLGWDGGILGKLIWIISLGVCIQGLFHSVNFWANRHRRYKQMSIATICESVTDRGLVLSWSFLTETSPLGLIMGRIVGPIVSLLILFYKSVYPSLLTIKEAANWTEMKRLAVRYRDFPLYSSWSFLASALSRELPTILLAVLFSPIVAGFYGLGLRVMNMPMMLIGDSIATAFLQKAASERDNISGLEIKIRKLVIYSIILILPFAIEIIVFGKEIFAWVFGTKWLEAGSMVQVLMLVFVCLFLYRLVSVLFDVYEKQRERLRLDIIMLVARFLSLVLIAYIGGTELQAIMLLAVSSIVVYAISFRYLFWLVKINYNEFTRTLISKLLIFIPFSIFIYILAVELNFQNTLLMVALALLAATQYLVIILTDMDLRRYAVKTLSRKR